MSQFCGAAPRTTKVWPLTVHLDWSKKSCPNPVHKYIYIIAHILLTEKRFSWDRVPPLNVNILGKYLVWYVCTYLTSLSSKVTRAGARHRCPPIPSTSIVQARHVVFDPYLIKYLDPFVSSLGESSRVWRNGYYGLKINCRWDVPNT